MKTIGTILVCLSFLPVAAAANPVPSPQDTPTARQAVAEPAALPDWMMRIPGEPMQLDRRTPPASDSEARYRAGTTIPYVSSAVGIRWAPIVDATNDMRTRRCRDAKSLHALACQ